MIFYKDSGIFLLLSIFLIQIICTNSKTSTLWKLNTENGKIVSSGNNVAAAAAIQNQYPINNPNGNVANKNSRINCFHEPYDNDFIFDIITSTNINYGYESLSWTRKFSDNSECGIITDTDNIIGRNGQNIETLVDSGGDVGGGGGSSSGGGGVGGGVVGAAESTGITVDSVSNSKYFNNLSSVSYSTKSIVTINNDLDEVLDCGKPVNFTYYDELIGIAQRYNHPIVPEPEVASLFFKKKGTQSIKTFDILSLEKRLRKAKKDKPRSVQLYNQIGNYWRIKGNAKHSIECFRRALAISPTNSEVLLNLARVLFNLQYLDDAIHLTRRSLEVQPPDRSAWRQYFTLGEIFKAYGHFQESMLHLRHALDLHPQHEPIKQAIRDVENTPRNTINLSTVVIILLLVIGVILVILVTNETKDTNYDNSEPKSQRHFNRAMAMRSLKGITSSRTRLIVRKNSKESHRSNKTYKLKR